MRENKRLRQVPVLRTRIRREPDCFYYLDNRGRVLCEPFYDLYRPDRNDGHRTRTVCRAGIKRSPGWLYYVDAVGAVCRVRRNIPGVPRHVECCIDAVIKHKPWAARADVQIRDYRRRRAAQVSGYEMIERYRDRELLAVCGEIAAGSVGYREYMREQEIHKAKLNGVVAAIIAYVGGGRRSGVIVSRPATHEAFVLIPRTLFAPDPRLTSPVVNYEFKIDGHRNRITWFYPTTDERVLASLLAQPPVIFHGMARSLGLSADTPRGVLALIYDLKLDGPDSYYPGYSSQWTFASR